MADPAAHETTDDAFLGGRLRIRQPARGYRAGLDAVLLAASVPLEPNRTVDVLDLGAGVGTVGLAIAMRALHARVMLLERDPDLVRLATLNIAANPLDGRAVVIAADVGATAADLASAGLAPDSIDNAVANPPYFTEGHGIRPARAQRATSHQMPEGGIEVWVKAAARAVRPGGTLTLIHRAEALGPLLASLDGRFGGIEIKPLAAHDGEPATRILLHARKGSRAPLVLQAPLITHSASGGYTDHVAAIIAAPAALACFG